MSNIRVNTINDANGGSAAVLYGVASPPNSMGFRNRIINGEMRIDQRNNGASVTLAASSVYVVDRWFGFEDSDGGATAQQSAIAPPGFTNSLLFTVTSADSSLTTTQSNALGQYIEGFNVADLGWGAAGAQSVTLSFWVRSSLTGTFGGALTNSANDRSYVFSYSISAANTWEYKTVTISGDTSGTWLTNNGRGIRVLWSMGSGPDRVGTAGSWSASNTHGVTGQTQLVGTSGATFYITGVQLEAGTVATPFERRDYGRELMMCQRYYEVLYANASAEGIFSATSVNGFRATWFLEVVKRSTPTFALGSGAAWQINTPTGIAAGLNQVGFYHASTQFYCTQTVGLPVLIASSEL